MSAPTRRTLRDELEQEFMVACAELTDARLQCYFKDSMENRAAVETAEREINDVLDMWLESERESSDGCH